MKKDSLVTVKVEPTDVENSPLNIFIARQGGIDLNKIYTEDCLKTMGRMEKETVTLTVTSPPYDGLRKYNGYSFDFEPIARELFRVTKDGGVVVWVVGDAIEKGSETLTSFRQALHFKEVGFNVHDTMLYKKKGMRFPERSRYGQIFEYMFVFSKGVPKTTHMIKDRLNRWAGYTNWGKNSTRDPDGNLIRERVKKDGTIVQLKDCKRYRMWGARTNIWEYANGFGFGTTDKDSYKHPAMYPELLVRDHIFSWSNEGDLIYDPFMGSGTTAKVAILMNRNYVGSEVSPEYVGGALKRLAGVEAQRGSLLTKIAEEDAKRLEEEEEHMKMVEEETRKLAAAGKNKKWQPKQPDKNEGLDGGVEIIDDPPENEV